MANSRKSPTAESFRVRRRTASPDAGTGSVDAIESRVEQVFSNAALRAGMRVCIALSGGLDSMVLLEIVHRLRSRLGIHLSALHVHHGLSAHAGQWAEFCRQACESRGIAYEMQRVDVRAVDGASLEARARDLRYACFATVEADVLLLAHHLDDQCETFFLRLLRGSGLHGLLGMPASRPLAPAATAPPLAGVMMLRPLLDITRTQLHEYATVCGLRWVQDESNDDTALTRNYLRAEVLPRIEARFPAYRKAIARALDSLNDAAAIVDRQAHMDLDAANLQGSLRVNSLAALDSGRALNALRTYLAQRGCRAPSRALLLEAWRQLRDAGPDAQVHVSIGQGELRRYRDAIHWAPLPAALTAVAPCLWLGEARLAWLPGRGELRFHAAHGKGIRAVSMPPARVAVVHAVGNMRLKPDATRPSRTLKNLFQEHAVPPWIRQVTPVLRAGGNTLWVGGLGYDCRHLAAPNEAGFQVEWISAPSG